MTGSEKLRAAVGVRLLLLALWLADRALDIGGAEVARAMQVATRRFFAEDSDRARRWLGTDLPLQSAATRNHDPATARARDALRLVRPDSAEPDQRRGVTKHDTSGRRDADQLARPGPEAVPERDATGGAGLSDAEAPGAS